MKKPTFKRISENALSVLFGEKPDLDTFTAIQQFVGRLKQEPFTGLREVVPGYTSVVLFFDPLLINKNQVNQPLTDAVIEQVSHLLKPNEQQQQSERMLTIPVCYDEKLGPDLTYLATARGMTVEEVIERHTAKTYLVHMIGFAPGFPFLGGMDQALATPRKSKPRERVNAGSVGIAGSQTGVYPMATPGGWQLIGQTPLALFDANKQEPSYFRAGDRVQFQSISLESYQRLKAGELWLSM